jgi:hypothetical protein
MAGGRLYSLLTPLSSMSVIDYMLSKIPMGRFNQVEEVCLLICWLPSEECSYGTGAAFQISGDVRVDDRDSGLHISSVFPVTRRSRIESSLILGDTHYAFWRVPAS